MSVGSFFYSINFCSPTVQWETGVGRASFDFHRYWFDPARLYRGVWGYPGLRISPTSRRYEPWRTWVPWVRRHAHPGTKTFEVIVPLWIPFLMFALPTAFLCHRDRRFPRGLCQACGYNLTGNMSGVCPECGQRI